MHNVELVAGGFDQILNNIGGKKHVTVMTQEHHNPLTIQLSGNGADRLSCIVRHDLYRLKRHAPDLRQVLCRLQKILRLLDKSVLAEALFSRSSLSNCQSTD